MRWNGCFMYFSSFNNFQWVNSWCGPNQCTISDTLQNQRFTNFWWLFPVISNILFFLLLTLSSPCLSFLKWFLPIKMFITSGFFIIIVSFITHYINGALWIFFQYIAITGERTHLFQQTLHIWYSSKCKTFCLGTCHVNIMFCTSINALLYCAILCFCSGMLDPAGQIPRHSMFKSQ